MTLGLIAFLSTIVSFSALLGFFFLKEACYQASFLSVVLVFDVNSNIPKMIDDKYMPIEIIIGLVDVINTSGDAVGKCL